MDSITQAALGASVAGLVAGRKCSPKVLLAGAALGTLPDLDVLVDYGDPVANMVNHRGFSHSLLVLFPFSLVLAALWYKWRATTWSFASVWLLVAACLITHPLLDAFTSYGTQLFWPLDVPSVSISSIFIIDPLYTVPLLICLIAALIWRARGAKLCGIGLTVSTLYLVWSLAALNIIENRVEQAVKGTPLEHQPVFITPTPFNTVLWRVVVLEDTQYWEGLASLLDESDDIAFMPFDRGIWPISELSDDVSSLDVFASGFIRFEELDQQIIVTDLRLGLSSYHPFRFVLAQTDIPGSWQSVPPVQLDPGPVLPRTIPALWLRLLGNQNIDAMLCNEKDCFRDEG